MQTLLMTAVLLSLIVTLFLLLMFHDMRIDKKKWHWNILAFLFLFFLLNHLAYSFGQIDKGENYYRAYNEDGYYLSLSYEGNNIMLIRIDEPQKGAEAAAGTENVTEETAKQEVEETVAESRTEEIATESETEEQQPAMDSDTSTVGEDGMRKDFKEAMDSYEAFMNEYCDFMEKYSKNPTDASLMADYMSYMSKYDDFIKKFDQWGGEDLNDAEFAYYMEVQTRAYERLAEAAY